MRAPRTGRSGITSSRPSGLLRRVLRGGPLPGGPGDEPGGVAPGPHEPDDRGELGGPLAVRLGDVERTGRGVARRAGRRVVVAVRLDPA